MFTIKAAAELTAVPPATLRAWERRYGIARAQRTESGYRLYDQDAIEEIRVMQDLLERGWAAKQAAEQVVRQRELPRKASTVSLPSDNGLLAAARSLDERAMAGVLDEAFTSGSFEYVIDGWLTPALHQLGAAWLTGDLDIAAEHFASAAIMRRLSVAYEAAGVSAAGPRVLVGLPAGAQHEIPSLASATCLRRLGLNALYLGSNLPASSWVKAATAQPLAEAVVMSITVQSDIPGAIDAMSALRAVRPELCIAVGGSQAPHVPHPTLLLEGTIPESALRISEFLRTKASNHHAHHTKR
ncbi:MAG: MerR family transcriptional regulator [Candidatus Nanopelagicales bacterium]